MRIGEILVQGGVVTASDVEEALAVARARGLRLASALVTLGRCSADDASRALAQQHGVPAALEKHLAARDVALATLLPPHLAWSLAALPIATQRGRDALVVVVRDPVPSAVTSLERVVHRPVVLAVAVECALMPLIGDAYQASDPSVPIEVDIDVDTGPVVEADEHGLGTLELVDLDHASVTKDHSQSAMPAPFLAVGTEPGVKKGATGPFDAIGASSGVRTLALDPALVTIAAAEDPDVVVQALLAFLRHRFAAGVVFVCKDNLALAQVGFGDGLAPEVFASIVVPLSQPSVLRAVHDRGSGFVGAPQASGVVQDRFFKLFGGVPATVVVVPVVINKRVVNLLYGHGPRGASVEDAASELGTLAEAAEEAFVRIIRESKG